MTKYEFPFGHEFFVEISIIVVVCDHVTMKESLYPRALKLAYNPYSWSHWSHGYIIYIVLINNRIKIEISTFIQGLDL